VQNDGGPDYVLAIPDPDAAEGEAPDPHILITGGDDGAAHAPHEHSTGWSAWLHDADGGVVELYAGTGGDCAKDSADCAQALAHWRDAAYDDRWA
jgi:hypothetical protein